jgi:hypothetical protein
MAFFPTSIATDANLYVAVNGVQTTLASPALISDTTLTLTSTSFLPITGAMTIIDGNSSEVVFYTGISGNTLTGVVRGADGTVAFPHPPGVLVGATIVAAHHNLLKNEIEAIEQALGVGYTKTLASLNDVSISTPTIGQFLEWNGTSWANTTTPLTGITVLTGDVTATGPGSAAATLATVNSNVGSFTNANITVNAKGLITAATSGSVGVTSVTGTANQVIASASTGAVTLSLPQAIGTASDTTFRTLTLTGNGTQGLILQGTNIGVSNTSSFSVSSSGGSLSLGGTTVFVVGNLDLHSGTDIVLHNSANTHAITINYGAITADYSLNLPQLQGGASTFLQNDGSGNLSWAAGGSGSVNTGTQYQLAYYATSTNTVSGDPSIITNAAGDLGVQSTGTLLGVIQMGADAGRNTFVELNIPRTGVSSAHGFGDYTSVTESAGGGYASYETQAATAGSANGDHIDAFQANVSHGSTGTLNSLYSFNSVPVVQAGAGVVGGVFDFYASNVTVSGATPTNQYGLYVEHLVSAVNNYGIFFAGANKTDFGASKLSNIANGTAATDAAAVGQLPFVQVISFSTATQFTTTSSTFQTTNLTATITPTSASSKIFIIASSNLENGGVSKTALATIARNGTNILGVNGQGYYLNATDNVVPCTLSYMDSPATTSATTYAVQIRNIDNATTIQWGQSNTTQSILLVEVR